MPSAVIPVTGHKKRNFYLSDQNKKDWIFTIIHAQTKGTNAEHYVSSCIVLLLDARGIQ